MTFKKCTKCNEVKSLNLFHKHTGCSDGHKNTCKVCTKLKYDSKDRDVLRKRKREYVLFRLKTDPEYWIAHSLRKRLRHKLSLKNRIHSPVSELGCSVFELRLYLESKFKPGMTWFNHGTNGWHLDHIKPLSSFNLTNSEDFKKACHFSNLQPLWAHENRAKSDKLVG